MIFGTDGVRGVVDKDIDTKLAYDIGKGLAIQINNKNLVKKVVIGKDTRLSSDSFVAAVACGLSDYGIDVYIIGIVSTPIVSFIVSKMDFGGGVMITASHNDYSYNGIKIFSEIGDKLNKNQEDEIEKNINILNNKPLNKGKIIYDESLVSCYINYIMENFKLDLSNLSIVLDCANGSNYKIAPQIFKNLNANIICINCINDGLNINNNCGANNIENTIRQVKEHKADFGFAFDGDGDRLRIVMSDGKVLSGDDILYLFAMCLKNKFKLNNLSVVGTVMTNMGIEHKLLNNGIRLIRTDVGDKNVINMIKERSLSLGGESSGHICIYVHNPTCDALINAVIFLKFYYEHREIFNDYFNDNCLYPSLIENVSVSNDFRKNFDSNVNLKNQIHKLVDSDDNARIVIRPSGTEPVIRIFVESNSEDKNLKLMQKALKLIQD